MVELALVLPLLLVLFLGIADVGRVFQAGIVIEAAARDAAELIAEEYRRQPPGGHPMIEPAPPGSDSFYRPLHELGARAACREMRVLANTTYVPDDPATPAVNEEACVSDDPSAGMPAMRLCIHDGQDTLCDEIAFGVSVPDDCPNLSAPMTPVQTGGAEASRYVEVRICYRFTTLFNFQYLSIGTIWLERDRVFTVAQYPPPPTPSPPPEASPPDPEPLPSETASPSPSDSPTPSPTPSTPTPVPTPCALPTAAFSVATAPASNVSPVTATFTNTSSAPAGCPITSYAWVFGNGNTSSAQDPSPQTYTHPGPSQNRTFTITLTVTSSSGSSTATRTITVKKP